MFMFMFRRNIFIGCLFLGVFKKIKEFIKLLFKDH